VPSYPTPNSDEYQAVLASLTAYLGALLLLVILGRWWGPIAIGSAKALAFHGFLPRLALLPLSVARLTL
jgi:hypothetical protein